MEAIFLGGGLGRHEGDWNAIWADGSWTETAEVADAYAFFEDGGRSGEDHGSAEGKQR